MPLEILYDDAPTLTAYSDEGGEKGPFAPVAVDHDLEAIYFVKVFFAPYDEAVEFGFCIMRRERVTDTITEFWSGRQTAHLFDDEARDHIRMVLQALTNLLITREAPDEVFRCTYDNNPPDKALDKHHFISNVFRFAGYETITSDVWQDGKRWWRMRKVDLTT